MDALFLFAEDLRVEADKLLDGCTETSGVTHDTTSITAAKVLVSLARALEAAASKRRSIQAIIEN